MPMNPKKLKLRKSPEKSSPCSTKVSLRVKSRFYTVRTSSPQSLKKLWQMPALSIRSAAGRSEEHTSELQSRFALVCRLLLEKKNASFTQTGGPGLILYPTLWPVGVGIA